MKVTIDLSSIIGENNQRKAYQAIKDKFEPALFTALLKHTDNNKKEAAKIAGISVVTLNTKLKKHGITVLKQVSQCGGEL